MSKNPGSNLSPVERIGSPPTVPNSLAEPLVETTGNNAINLAAWWYIRLDDGGDLQLVPHIDDVGTIYRHSIRVIGDIGLDQMKRRVDKIGETDHPPKKLKPETVVIEFRDHSWVMLLHNQKDEFGFSNPVGNPAVTTYKRPRRGGSSTTDSAELRQGGNDIGSLQDNLTSELAHHPEREPPGASSTADSAELRLQGNDIGRVQDNSTSELVHHPELEVSSRTVSAERVGIQMSGSPSSNLSPVERIGSPLDVLKSVAGPFVDTTGDNAPESAALWWYRRLKMTFAHNLMLDPEPETLGFMREIRVVGNIRMEEIHRWVADIANLSDRPERPVAVRIVGNGYTILIYHGENGHIRVSSRAHYPEPEASSTAVLAERRQCEDLGGVQNASAVEPPRPNYPNSSVPRPEHGGGFNHQHGGGPPGPWLGLPPNPPPPAFPNISWPNVPHPGGGFPWNCATPGAGLVPQMPRVSPPARRIVQLPFNAADQWESIYSPQKHAHTPPMMAYSPLPQLHAPFFYQQNLLHPDLWGPMNWRIYLPPSMARMHGHGIRNSAPQLTAYATSPPCTGLTISFGHPSLMHWMERWGAIRVPVSFRYITVGDVLSTIHNFFSVPLSQSDLAAIAPQDRGKVAEGGRERQMRGYPHVQPVPLRADVLNYAVFFAGLRLLSISGQTAFLGLQFVAEC